MDEEANCLICGELLSTKRTCIIQHNGLKSLISASLRRQDEKHIKFRLFKSLEIHDSCSKTYASEKALSVIDKKNQNSERRTRRSGILGFEYGQLCLICAEDASEEFIEKQNRKNAVKRDVVCIIDDNKIRNNLLKHCETNISEMSIEVYNRLSAVDNLVAVGARYHRRCYKVISKKTEITDSAEDSLALKAGKFIASYILENRDECQFSVYTILDKFNDFNWPAFKYVKNHLFKIFGDQIIIHSSKNGPIITFSDVSKKILSDHFYKKRDTDKKEERKRIVREASKIILDDIRNQQYDVESYPSPDAFLDNVKSDIPETLQIMLDTIISHRKSNASKYCVKQFAIAHAIITSTRPKSFISSLLLGLAVTLNKKYASKELIEILNSLGFCSSYKDLQLFEGSVLENPQEKVYDGTFLQYVFDNADHNINTIDGRNTFHSMGGIEIETPLTLVQRKEPIKKLKNIPSSIKTGKFGHVAIKYFKKQLNSGWNCVSVENLSNLYPISMSPALTSKDFLWICGRKNHPDYFIGWHGFMEHITKELSYSRSKINFLPFVNAPPSNYDTVYTVLLEADSRRRASGQNHTFVTFDQPLYYKAREIVESCKELSNVIPVLGGFHTLMSFIGAIGFIMEGSGLAEAFCELYAENSVEKILNGSAYARSVRGHILTHAALSELMLSSFTMVKEDVEMIEDTLGLEEEILNYLDSEEFQRLYKQFLSHVEKLRGNGPTAKLWTQYYDMVKLF